MNPIAIITAAKELAGTITGGLDNLFTSKEEKLEAEQKIQTEVSKRMFSVIESQSEIILAESKGNWLQRSWRPLVMLSFALIVMYVYFFGPMFSATVPDLRPEFWELLKIGMGGYIVGRSAEKISKPYFESKKPFQDPEAKG